MIQTGKEDEFIETPNISETIYIDENVIKAEILKGYQLERRKYILYPHEKFKDWWKAYMTA